MKFNTTSEYAIRVLSHMAISKEKHFSSSTLSAILDIPYKYLTRIMTSLVKSGFIKSQRGRAGGISIAKDLNDIKIEDILIALNDFDNKSCIMGEGICTGTDVCALHTRWEDPKQMINNKFMKTTLQDIKEDNS
jgi:Rrf2 family protein